MKKNTKSKIKNNLKTNWKKYSILGVVIIAIIIAITTLPRDNNPQLDPDYKGFYDESSGKVKVVKFFNGKDYKIDNCVFSNLQFSYSPSNSSFSGKFVSNNDKITGTVHIDFVLYDKDKKIIKSFHNDLKDVKNGEENIVLAEYFEEIDNVDSLSIRIQK